MASNLKKAKTNLYMFLINIFFYFFIFDSILLIHNLIMTAHTQHSINTLNNDIITIDNLLNNTSICSLSHQHSFTESYYSDSDSDSESDYDLDINTSILTIEDPDYESESDIDVPISCIDDSDNITMEALTAFINKLMASIDE